jgi:acetyl-CoA synthetase
MQTIWGDPERFIDTYFSKYCKDPDSTDWHDWPYVTGDGAMEAGDGYFRILGRVDDVINVAGHRLGTKELESAVLTVDAVGEAAAVPAFDHLKGRVPEIYLSLKPGFESTDDVVDQAKAAVTRIIGPIARPSHIWVTEDLPKTRSGKIMRRVIASISNFLDVGDTTTLANPEIVEGIRKQVQSAKVRLGVVPTEIPKELEEELKRLSE